MSPGCGTKLIKDAKSLLACVMRMHLTDGAVVFWNATREFRMMLRNDATESDVVSFDLCIAPDDCDDDDDDDDDDRRRHGPLHRVLELEHDGYEDDGGMFVVDEQSFAAEELARRPGLLDDAVERINAVYNYSVCKCNSYFIKDGAPVCLYCQMTQDGAADGAQELCPICYESGPEQHMLCQPCCSQKLHPRCLALWVASSRNARCPMCRG